MTRDVTQHPLDLHPTFRNERFTLRGIFSTRAQAESKIESLRAVGMKVLLYTEDAPDGSQPYMVAAKHDVKVGARASMPHQKDVPWRAAAFAVALFRRIARSSYGRPVRRWYKPLEADVLRRVLQRLDWTGSNMDVSARIVSDTILAHPFPNANHRTAIDLARYYLDSAGIQWPHYDLRGKGRRARFYGDTKGFFFASKYLLQLVRHRRLVERAVHHGYDGLLIGRESAVLIREEDLGLNRAALNERHLAAARRLIKGLAGARAEAKLQEPRGRSLRQWVDWMESRAA